MHQFPSTCLELRAPLQPYNDDGDFYGIVCDNDKETLFQFAAGLNTTVFPPPEQRFANFLENMCHTNNTAISDYKLSLLTVNQ